MKLLTSIKIGLLCGAMVSGVWMTQEPVGQTAACNLVTQEHHDSMASVQASCVKVHQPSWFDWLTGKSRSTQFHFIDLVELISQLKPSTDTP